MFSSLSLISGVVSLFKNIAGYFRDKQLLDAGRDKERVKRHEEERKRVNRANDVRNSKRVRSDKHYRD